MAKDDEEIQTFDHTDEVVKMSLELNQSEVSVEKTEYSNQNPPSYDATELTLEKAEGTVFHTADGRELRIPTSEQLQTLRRVPERMPVGAFFIVIVELLERFCYYGLSTMFQNYMFKELKFTKSQATATSNFIMFWNYITPIGGAILADTKLGRFKTICYSCVIYIIGLTIITGTSAIPLLDKGKSTPGFLVATFIIGFGTGGIKTNVGPLLADQIPKIPRHVSTTKTGESVIVDPALTYQRIFSLFYFCINVGSLAGIATVMMEKQIDNKRGYWSGNLLSTLMFLLAPVVLVLGYRHFKLKPPDGSIILRGAQVIYVYIRNGFNWECCKPSFKGTSSKYSHLKKLWDDQFVDEVYRAINACSVFLFFPIFWVCYNQMTNNLTSMAGTMSQSSVPNDFFTNFNPLVIVVCVPLLEYVVYPGLRKVGIRFLPITRIFFGLLLVSMSMAYAAIVQHLIYKSAPYYKQVQDSGDANEHNDVNVFLSIPCFVLIGLSEIFAVITSYEYAYTKAPLSMKSMISALNLLTVALGSLLSMALAPYSVNPKFVWLYTSVSIAAFISGLTFIFVNGKYNKMEDAMNNIEVTASKENREELKRILVSKNTKFKD